MVELLICETAARMEGLLWKFKPDKIKFIYSEQEQMTEKLIGISLDGFSYRSSLLNHILILRVLLRYL